MSPASHHPTNTIHTNVRVFGMLVSAHHIFYRTDDERIIGQQLFLADVSTSDT